MQQPASGRQTTLVAGVKNAKLSPAVAGGWIVDSTPQPQQRTSHRVVVVVAASSLPALAAAAAAATHRGKVPSLGLATRARPRTQHGTCCLQLAAQN